MSQNTVQAAQLNAPPTEKRGAEETASLERRCAELEERNGLLEETLARVCLYLRAMETVLVETAAGLKPAGAEKQRRAKTAGKPEGGAGTVHVRAHERRAPAAPKESQKARGAEAGRSMKAIQARIRALQNLAGKAMDAAERAMAGELRRKDGEIEALKERIAVLEANQSSKTSSFPPSRDLFPAKGEGAPSPTSPQRPENEKGPSGSGEPAETNKPDSNDTPPGGGLSTQGPDFSEGGPSPYRDGRNAVLDKEDGSPGGRPRERERQRTELADGRPDAGSVLHRPGPPRGKDWTLESEGLGGPHAVVGIGGTEKHFAVTQVWRNERTGKKTVRKGSLPYSLRPSVQYGERLRLLVFLLNMLGCVPARKTAGIVNLVFGTSMGKTTVNRIVSSFGKNLQKARELIKDKTLEECRRERAEGEGPLVFNCDETGVRAKAPGKAGTEKLWDWVIVTPFASLHTVAPGRGIEEGLKKSGILQNFSGHVVSDFWKPYRSSQFSFVCVFCWAHVERELRKTAKVLRAQGKRQEWLPLMERFARESYRAWRDARDAGGQIAPAELDRLAALYDEAVALGLKENAGAKKGKVIALLRRLDDYRGGLLAHLYDVRLPRTNNAAERALRPMKLKLKVAGLFRSKESAAEYADFLSVYETAQIQGLDPLGALVQVLFGNAGYLFTHAKDPGLDRLYARPATKTVGVGAE